MSMKNPLSHNFTLGVHLNGCTPFVILYKNITVEEMFIMTTTFERIQLAGRYSKVDICKNNKVYIRNIYYNDEFLCTRTTHYDKDGFVEKTIDCYSDGTTNC